MPAEQPSFLPAAVAYQQALGGNLQAVLAAVADAQLGVPVYDSRLCQPGSIFVAIRGLHHDGHDYMEQAVNQGARLVVCQQMPSRRRPGVGYWQVADSRRALSSLAACAYQWPSTKLQVVGVTGTDGKTSTCYFIYQLLTRLGLKTALMSTFARDNGSGLAPNLVHQTTPEAPEVQAFLAQARAQGCSHVVLESSSHGLSLQTSRLADVRFCTAVFTNLSPEHLEFHHTMERYAQDKANLFRQLSGTAIVNGDDVYAEMMLSACASNPCWRYGSAPGAELQLLGSRKSMEGSQASIRLFGEAAELQVAIPGSFYLDNAALALLACLSCSSFSVREILPLLPQLRPPTGRMQRVDLGQDFYALIDYAHSPGAFARLLPELRSYTRGRLVLVFGSGGERDRKKRPLQGELADRYADVVILTNEDPRQEDPMTILREIAAGVKQKREGEGLLLLPNRSQAIAHACNIAQAGDTVALLGKGHETNILMGEGEIEWNEENALRSAISTRC